MRSTPQQQMTAPYPTLWNLPHPGWPRPMRQPVVKAYPSPRRRPPRRGCNAGGQNRSQTPHHHWLPGFGYSAPRVSGLRLMGLSGGVSGAWWTRSAGCGAPLAGEGCAVGVVVGRDRADGHLTVSSVGSSARSSALYSGGYGGRVRPPMVDSPLDPLKDPRIRVSTKPGQLCPAVPRTR